MEPTRVELAVEQMDWDDGDDFTCDDLRTACLAAELNRDAGVKGSIESLWLDR